MSWEDKSCKILLLPFCLFCTSIDAFKSLMTYLKLLQYSYDTSIKWWILMWKSGDIHHQDKDTTLHVCRYNSIKLILLKIWHFPLWLHVNDCACYLLWFFFRTVASSCVICVIHFLSDYLTDCEYEVGLTRLKTHTHCQTELKNIWHCSQIYTQKRHDLQ